MEAIDVEVEAVDEIAASTSLVNTHFWAENVSTVLEYFDVAESENDIDFSELALVFEIFHISVSKKC